MSGVAVVQARTDSHRLPAKALLPVGGLPMAVLAARRAANTGREVIVATSSTSCDDALAAALQRYGQATFRGDLDDVLGRVVAALAERDPEAVVFRLTADNVFPDGVLLDEMEDEFSRRGVAYLRCNGAESGVPYGVSVEVTRLRFLREAAVAATSAHDREHVLPYVRRTFGDHVFDRHRALGRGIDRCTVDSLDDFQRVQRVFDGVADPVGIGWQALVARLARLPDAPIVDEPVARLVLGGAQLGLSYGIANVSGPPDAETCEALVKTAVGNGVAWIDTARAYGGSEAALGRVLRRGWRSRVRVATKLSPLDAVAGDASASCIAAHVDASVQASRAALHADVLDALLLHRAAHLDAWGGAAWRRLVELEQDGLIGALGVSVQTPAELVRALDAERASLIQLPFNIADDRWGAAIEQVVRAKARRPLVVHARSALLQGLLPATDPALWRRANVADPGAAVAWLATTAAALGRRDVADLCLAYIRSQPWIDGVVVGCERLDQLRANIAAFVTAPLDAGALAQIERGRPAFAEATLDPSCWQAAPP